MRVLTICTSYCDHCVSVDGCITTVGSIQLFYISEYECGVVRITVQIRNVATTCVNKTLINFNIQNTHNLVLVFLNIAPLLPAQLVTVISASTEHVV